MKKKVLVAAMLATAVLALALAGCGTPVSEVDKSVKEGLPAWADEAAVTAQAFEVIEDVNARDFKAVAERWNDAAITAEKLEQSIGAGLDKLGAFKGYGDVSFLQGDADGRSYATVVQVVEYENAEDPVRVSFYEDGSMAGFFM